MVFAFTLVPFPNEIENTQLKPQCIAVQIRPPLVQQNVKSTGSGSTALCNSITPSLMQIFTELLAPLIKHVLNVMPFTRHPISKRHASLVPDLFWLGTLMMPLKRLQLELVINILVSSLVIPSPFSFIHSGNQTLILLHPPSSQLGHCCDTTQLVT